MNLKKYKEDNTVYYYRDTLDNFETLSTYSKTCRSDLIIDGGLVVKCRWGLGDKFLEKLIDNHLLEKGEEEVNA